MIKHVKTLSTRTVVGNKVKLLASAQVGEAMELYRVYGNAVGYSSKDADHGQVFTLLGNFKAVRSRDGGLFLSQRFRPLSTIYTEVAELLDLQSVIFAEFAYSVSIVSKPSIAGYEFYTAPLITTVAADPLASVDKKIALGLSAGKIKPQLWEIKKKSGKAKAKGKK